MPDLSPNAEIRDGYRPAICSRRPLFVHRRRATRLFVTQFEGEPFSLGGDGNAWMNLLRNFVFARPKPQRILMFR
jgi:hypothetical protein